MTCASTSSDSAAICGHAILFGALDVVMISDRARARERHSLCECSHVRSTFHSPWKMLGTIMIKLVLIPIIDG
jgi:hypothetical protein